MTVHTSGPTSPDAWTVLRARLGGYARPPVATPRVLAVTTGLLYLTGGLLVLLTLAVPGSSEVHWVPIMGIGLVAMATGAVTLLFGRQFPYWTYDVLVTSGTVLITALVCLGGGSASSLGYAALYTFVAIDCFFFFAWPRAALHLTGFEICSFLALWFVDMPVPQILVQQGCATVVAFTVGWLVRAAAAADQDPLTSLTNRRGLDRLLEAAFQSPTSDSPPLSVIMLDLDHFKTVNDVNGHAYGDRVLCAVSHAWTTLLRPEQTLIRLGGDEFAVVLPGCPVDRAVTLADDLRDAVAQHITCSAGVAQRQSGDSRSILLNRADVALYEAKAMGRNRTAWREVDHRTGATAITAALDAGQFQVYYQPIVCLDTLVVSGHEALIRWNHPDRGLIAPTEFIPAAEESGAIHALGAWILEQACLRSVELSEETGRPHRVSVNASGVELRCPGYADMVAATIARAGLDPTSLVLEVTESTLDGDHCDVLATLHELRRLRIKIAIDDFGTGYSTLNRLHNLPVDILKIDRSFVMMIDEVTANAPILTAITTLAEAMCLETVAEGIETEQQAAVLTKLGCHYGQGYRFGRPGPEIAGSTGSSAGGVAA